MIERDERTPEEIRQVIEFAQSDPFWCSNILSTQKLRKQFDTLYLQMKNRGKKQKPSKDFITIDELIQEIREAEDKEGQVDYTQEEWLI